MSNVATCSKCSAAVETRFCGHCGTPVNKLSLYGLVAHVDSRVAAVKKLIDSATRAERHSDDLTKKTFWGGEADRHMRHLAKWQSWADALHELISSAEVTND